MSPTPKAYVVAGSISSKVLGSHPVDREGEQHTSLGVQCNARSARRVASPRSLRGTTRDRFARPTSQPTKDLLCCTAQPCSNFLPPLCSSPNFVLSHQMLGGRSRTDGATMRTVTEVGLNRSISRSLSESDEKVFLRIPSSFTSSSLPIQFQTRPIYRLNWTHSLFIECTSTFIGTLPSGEYVHADPSARVNFGPSGLGSSNTRSIPLVPISTSVSTCKSVIVSTTFVTLYVVCTQ